MKQANRLATIAITGGTFDPIHRGHVDTVRQVCEQIQLDRVHYIPAAVPPHRAQPTVSAKQRLAMVSLAIAQFDSFNADDRELRRDGPSYTLDTLIEIRDEYPDASLMLLLGLDAFLGLPTWDRWEQVLDFAHIIVMNRPGWEQPDPLPAWLSGLNLSKLNSKDAALSSLYARTHGQIVRVTITPIAASSTQVRQRIAAGDMPLDVLMPAVVDYIAQHKLYDWPESTQSNSSQDLSVTQTAAQISVEELKDIAIDRIDDAKGRDITVNDVRGMTDITDYMIIASGTSDRHVHAIAQRVSDGMSDKGLKPVGTEGQDDDEWVVLDYGDVVVHVMQHSVRQYYDLDGLWNENVRKLVEENREKSNQEQPDIDVIQS